MRVSCRFVPVDHRYKPQLSNKRVCNQILHQAGVLVFGVTMHLHGHHLANHVFVLIAGSSEFAAWVLPLQVQRVHVAVLYIRALQNKDMGVHPYMDPLGGGPTCELCSPTLRCMLPCVPHGGLQSMLSRRESVWSHASLTRGPVNLLSHRSTSTSSIPSCMVVCGMTGFT